MIVIDNFLNDEIILAVVKRNLYVYARSTSVVGLYVLVFSLRFFADIKRLRKANKRLPWSSCWFSRVVRHQLTVLHATKLFKAS